MHLNCLNVHMQPIHIFALYHDVQNNSVHSWYYGYICIYVVENLKKINLFYIYPFCIINLNKNSYRSCAFRLNWIYSPTFSFKYSLKSSVSGRAALNYDQIVIFYDHNSRKGKFIVSSTCNMIYHQLILMLNLFNSL